MMKKLQNDDAVSKFTFLVLEVPAEAISGFERNTQVRRTGQGNKVVVSMMEPNPGFLLLGSDLRPLYVNPEATQILAYPDTPRSIGPLDSFLLRKIRAVFFAHGNEGQFASEFLSGRRRYLCRAYWLCPPSNNALNHPALAVLLERSSPTSFDASEISARFHLTPREQETLEYLIEGLTNKEIGHRMNVSPNTVKGFLKLIMIKLGVSTRSGVIGRAVSPARQRCSHVATAASNPYLRMAG